MDWQPIVSIPETERCLLWVADAGYGGEGAVKFGRATRGELTGRLLVSAEGLSGDWQITHWQPMPAPPANQAIAVSDTPAARLKGNL